MKLTRSDTIRNIVGKVIVLLGILTIPLPSLLMFGINDAGIPPISVFSVSFGFVLGLPLIGVGVFLTQERYRSALFSGLIAGAVFMTIAGLVLLLAQGSGS